MCDPVLRLAGAGYGGSKETSTTVCGDEGRCVVCNLQKTGCKLIADCCDGDQHEIERDFRGLSGGHAIPRLWVQVLQGASKTFYTKYTQYKKLVAHANAGGAIQREVVSMAELTPSHVRRGFARVYHESRTISPTRLVVAVESHAGHG